MSEIPPGALIVHEPHGFVDLVDWAGDDLTVVNAARVSFRKKSDWDWSAWDRSDNPRLKDADEKVLRFLMKNRHGTPFEHNMFTFHVRAPIFVMREWHRHRIGVSINEESGRYVELRPDFYYPDDDHVRGQVGKPGSYTFESRSQDGPEVRIALAKAYRAAFDTYEHLLDAGIAKEIARAALPVATYSQMYWTCNARSLMSFLSLRNAPQALREIRDYAEALEKIFLEYMPVTAQAFIDGGRVAP